MTEPWGLVAGCLLAAVALFSRRLSRSPVTMPMICLGAGFAVAGVGKVPFGTMEHGLKLVAEATLAVILFVDASCLTGLRLRDDARWPARMLLVGMPLTILLGTAVFLVILPDLTLWQAALLAALLAPTDAALGRGVFSNEAIPEPVRGALSTESGLNDGLALPIIVFLSCAAVGFDHELVEENWFLFAFLQVAVGVGAGVALGVAGGWLSHRSVRWGWAFEDNTAIFGLLLVGIAWLTADRMGGNGFIAVFVAGFFFGRLAEDCADRTRTFLRTDGELLMMVSFFYIGAIMLPEGLAALDWRIGLCVVLSLFAIRPLAIWFSLTGTGATSGNRLLLGWFGPRGLATALFTLIVLDDFMDALPAQTLIAAGGLAVALSALLHGMSAHWIGSIRGKAIGE